MTKAHAVPAASAAGTRAAVAVALLALSAQAVPAAAQTDTVRAPTRAVAPARPPVVQPRVQDASHRGLWARLRDGARRVREMNGGPLTFAMRYRISPRLARQIHTAAEQEGIDPDLGFRLVRAESGFNPRARSHAGALGLTQLMPRTARWLDRRMTTPRAVMEPEANLRVGFRYLRRLIGKYGDLRLALLAYNRGEGAVDRDLRSRRNPENGYTRRVLGVGVDRYQGSGVQR
ncbi:MAG TPA: lytic transglycosylase domain-containing protein [Longimicrobium sp.]|nr:lytic transglycosylase domain-containing protein [Longimicrobium sp.]